MPSGQGSDERRVGAASLEERLGAVPLMPVIRAASIEDAERVAAICTTSGLDVLEITTTIPGWEQLLVRLRERFPDCSIGVGTILEVEQGTVALDRGAAFLVSPVHVPEVRAQCGADETLIEGGMSVTEIVQASRWGLAKLFPAGVLGVEYLRSLLTIAPSARVIPTGGIRLRDVPTWLDAGAFAVGVGQDLWKDPDSLAGLVRTLKTESSGRRGTSPS